MEAPLVADAYLDLLERSGLLSPEEFAAAVEKFELRRRAGPRDVAQLLVREELLTRFQAERILEGRYRGFFIDQYKILEILGAGGMACTYLATDTHTGQDVALKVLSDKHKTDAGMLARLKLEALAGKKLKHSSIVQTHSMHLTDDVFGDAHYLVMEYVEGINLEELINLKGPVPWPQAADFIRQAAAGLHHAHSMGMVHRDVKPGNLLVDAEGCVKILDFGLALIDSAEDEEFSLAMIFGHSCLGTADYIAPEQTYDSFAVDARADVYSLGCTLYVALTGKLPFPVMSSNDKLDGHRNRSAPPVRSIAPNVPVELAAIVERMMAKRPEDRFQSMAEVAEALTKFTTRMPVEFDFPKVLQWRAKEARRRFALHRRGGTGGASSVASSGALHGVNSGLSSTSTRRLPQATADTEVAPKGRLVPPGISILSPLDSAADAPPTPAESDPESAPRGPALISLDDGERLALIGNLVVIGREPGCHLRLVSSQISGRHCELRFDGSRWRVIDLGSKNGIQVNGVNVTDRVLRPGDRLSLARHLHLRIEYRPAPFLPHRALPWAVTGAIALAATLIVLRLLFG